MVSSYFFIHKSGRGKKNWDNNNIKSNDLNRHMSGKNKSNQTEQIPGSKLGKICS